MYRILSASKYSGEPPVWSLHWCMPDSEEQGIKDLENLSKNEPNEVFQLVKIEVLKDSR